MRLYHGTNIEFTKIDFNQCKPNKDFGRGFYLTDIKQQALDMAIRSTKFSEFNIYMLDIITIEELVKRLEYKKLNSQYFFGTEKAISKLKRIWH